MDCIVHGVAKKHDSTTFTFTLPSLRQFLRMQDGVIIPDPPTLLNFLNLACEQVLHMPRTQFRRCVRTHSKKNHSPPHFSPLDSHLSSPKTILVTSFFSLLPQTCVLTVLSCFSHVRLLQPHGLWPTRLLCPRVLQARILEWVAIPFSRFHRHAIRFTANMLSIITYVALQGKRMCNLPLTMRKHQTNEEYFVFLSGSHRASKSQNMTAWFHIPTPTFLNRSLTQNK